MLADKIQDHVENYTRFLLVSPEKRDVDDSVRNKTTLVVKLANNPGSLFHSLRPSSRNAESTSPRSKAVRLRVHLLNTFSLWIWFLSPAGQAVVFDAVEELKKISASVRLLGTYPMKPARVSP